MRGNLPRSWYNWLSLVEYWYNTNYHTAIKCTPFQALYGVPSPLHVPYFPKDSSVEAVDVFTKGQGNNYSIT